MIPFPLLPYLFQSSISLGKPFSSSHQNVNRHNFHLPNISSPSHARQPPCPKVRPIPETLSILHIYSEGKPGEEGYFALPTRPLVPAQTSRSANHPALACFSTKPGSYQTLRWLGFDNSFPKWLFERYKLSNKAMARPGLYEGSFPRLIPRHIKTLAVIDSFAPDEGLVRRLGGAWPCLRDCVRSEPSEAQDCEIVL